MADPTFYRSAQQAVAAPPERLAYVESAAQMLGARARGGDTAEIHNPFHAGGGSRVAEGRRRRDLAPVVVGALSHPVHQVERSLAAVERAGTGGGIPHIASHPIEGGLPLASLVHVTGQAADAPAHPGHSRPDRGPSGP